MLDIIRYIIQLDIIRHITQLDKIIGASLSCWLKFEIESSNMIHNIH